MEQQSNIKSYDLEALFSHDGKASEEGRFFQLDPDNPAEFRIVEFSSDRFTAAFDKVNRPLVQKYGSYAQAPSEVQREAAIDAMASDMLVGWRKFKLPAKLAKALKLSVNKGGFIPYTAAQAKRLLQSRTFRDAIWNTSRQEQSYMLAEAESAGKG